MGRIKTVKRRPSHKRKSAESTGTHKKDRERRTVAVDPLSGYSSEIVHAQSKEDVDRIISRLEHDAASTQSPSLKRRLMQKIEDVKMLATEHRQSDAPKQLHMGHGVKLVDTRPRASTKKNQEEDDDEDDPDGNGEQ